MLPALQLLLAVAGTYLLPMPHAARFRVWNEAGQPVTLVAYSFAVPQVAAAGDSLVATVTVQQWDSTSAVSFDSTFRAGGVRIDDHETRFSGLLQTPAAAALDSWSVTAAGGGLSAPIVVGQGSRPSHDGDAIAASDLLLGTSHSLLMWTQGDRRVPVGLDEPFAPTDVIEVNYQGWSRVMRPKIRTTMTVTDISDPHHGHRVLVLGSNDVLRQGVSNFTRELNVSRLRPGRYLIELTMGDEVSVSASAHSAEFVVQR